MDNNPDNHQNDDISNVLEAIRELDNEDDEDEPLVVPIARTYGFRLLFGSNEIPVVTVAGESSYFSPESEWAGIPVPETNALAPVEAKAIIFRCVACQHNQIQTVNFPCMHSCFCIQCAKPSVQYSEKCPVCRTKYVHISILYPSYIDAKSECESSSSSEEPPHKKQKT